MMTVVIILILFALMALADYPQLIKDKKWYEVKVLSVFFVAALVLAMAHIYDVKLPSPMEGIKYIVTDILKISYK